MYQLKNCNVLCWLLRSFWNYQQQQKTNKKFQNQLTALKDFKLN